MLPLQRERRLGALADALGIEVALAHRALADAETCARVLCALFPRLCANAADDRATRVALLTPRRPRRRRGRRSRDAAASAQASRRSSTSPSCRATRRLPVPRRRRARRCTSASRSRSAAGRGRTSRPSTPPARLDRARGDRRLPRDPLGARRAGAREPADQGAARRPATSRLTRRDDRLVYIRCRLDIPFPILEVVARARPPATRSRSGRCAAGGWRSSWSSSSTRCSACATAAGGCRAASIRRPTGRWAAACRRASATSTRTSTGAGSTRRCGCSSATATARERLLDHVERADARGRRGSARYERAAWLRRRARRLGRSSSGSAACSRRPTRGPRLVLAAHPAEPARSTRSGSSAAGWSTGGRCRGRATSWRAHRRRRSRAAAGPASSAAHVPPDEVDEVRIVGDLSGVASRRCRSSTLEPAPEPRRAARGSGVSANGSSTTSAATSLGRPRPTRPGGASRRTSASAIGPSAGETATLPSVPTMRSLEAQLGRPGCGGRRQPQAAQVAVRLAAVVQPRDRLLADVAALRERHRALVEAGLLGDHGVVEVDAVAGAAVLDPQALGGRLATPARRRRPAAPRAARSVSAASHSRSTPRSVRIARAVRRRRSSTGDVRVLGLARARARRRPRRLGADQRQQPALERALVQLARRSRC